MRSFFRGLSYWWRGWRLLIRRPSLLAIAVFPFLLSLSIAVGLVVWMYGNLPIWAQGFVQYVLSDYPTLLNILYYPLVATGGVIILVTGVFFAYIVQNLVAIPFYAILAERTLTIVGAKKKEPYSWRKWLSTTLHMFGVSLIKTAIFLILGVFLLACSFIPGLNFIALLGPLLLMAFDQLDYSFEALGYGFRRRIRFVLGNAAIWLGMAAGLGLTLIVPGLTLLLAPGAIVGASLLIHDLGKGHLDES